MLGSNSDPCLADDGTFLEHTPPSSSGGEGGGEGVGAASTPPPPHHHHHQWALAPSLTPASQPSISLLTDGGGADTLGVESLTLLPPAPLPLGPPSSIAEEEEEEGGEEGEGEGPGDAAATPLADFQGGDSTAGDGPQETREEEEDDDEEGEEGETHSQPTDALDSPELD